MPEFEPLPALRQAIQCRHRQLEALPVFARLFDDSLTPADYLATMTLLARFYQSVEPALAAFASDVIPVYQPRGPLCRQTLRQMGGALPLQSSSCLRLDGLPAYWGCRYVIEGSALGGQVIYQRLQGREDLDLAFWRVHVVMAKEWPEFQRLLQLQLNTASALRQACLQAEATFGLLLDLAANWVAC